MDESAALEVDERQAQARSGQRAPMILYMIIALLYWLALYLYVPTLPTYVETKTETLASVGIILAQYGLWQALIRLPLGIAADWLGRRKPFIIGGLILTGVGAVVMARVESPWGLGLGRAISGLGAGTWVPLSVAFTALFPPQEAVQATSILNVVVSLGRVAGTSATGPLNLLGGYPLAFYLAGVAAALALLLILAAPEKAHPSRQPSLTGLGRLLTRRDVLLPSVLSAAVQYVIWAISFSFMPLLAERLGATDITQSLLLSLHVGLVGLGSFVAAAVVRRIGTMRLLYVTFALLALGTATVALAPSLALVFVAQVFVSLAFGFGYPILMGLSIRDVDSAQRTTAMGLHQSVYSIGMFAGPWFSGLLADAIGIRPMLGMTAVLSLIVGWILIQLLQRH